MSVHDRPAGVARIAVGFDGSEGGRDAACLATMISRATGAEVTLVTVLPDPAVEIPSMDRSTLQESAAEARRELGDFMPPGARTLLEKDWSVPEALDRVARREAQDLLVVGSSSHAREGQVRISRRMRQLLGDAPFALAVVPRGLCAGDHHQLSTIGVGYDGKAEARRALQFAGSLASAAGARLIVRAVLEDRLPYAGWTPKRSPLYAERAGVQQMWDEVLEPDVQSLREDAERAAADTRAVATVEAKPGSPPEELIALSGQVDLLVIGSNRSGPPQVLLDRTGEELMRGARCAVMVVPRPPSIDWPHAATSSN
jgi:nucleotide-binding universal stress UspA family protein